jgi:hypothetical protein
MSMASVLVILADTKPLAQAVSRYLEHVWTDGAEVYYSDYEDACLVHTAELQARATLFLLECYRSYGNEGRRNEGIQVAKRLIPLGKRILLFALGAPERARECFFFWDPLGSRTLTEVMRSVTSSPPPTSEQLALLEQLFPSSYQPAGHGHGHSGGHGHGERRARE